MFPLASRYRCGPLSQIRSRDASAMSLRKFPVNFLLPLAICGTLAACGFARVPYETGQQASAQSSACDRSAGAAGQVRVCSGDTLSGLARHYNVTVPGLMRANGLSDGQIAAGQVLTLPDETVHVVQPGEQIGQIADRYGVSTQTLVAANGLYQPYQIYPNQRLSVPRDEYRNVAAMPAGSGSSLPTSPPVSDSAPQGPVIVDAAPQEHWHQENPSAPVAEQANPSSSSWDPAPPTVPSAPSSPAPEASAEQAVAVPAPVPRDRPTGTAVAAVSPSSNSASSSTAAARTGAASAKKSPSPATTAFLLPVQGRIVSEYGPKSGGLQNDGINISAPRGTPFHAAADGEVAYAGDGLPGFGNLILIRHADGWTSAYAHADTMAVKRGDKVTRGQVIGQVGTTGSVEEPQLHFELRKNDRAIDPKPLLNS
jgi:murein DD-endopeptidase MepM/ murein hydrolase activator NlpD